MLVLLFTLLVPFTHASYVCTVASVVGCYGDSAIKRILSHQTSSPSSSSLTLETCATQCAQDGYYLASDLLVWSLVLNVFVDIPLQQLQHFTTSPSAKFSNVLVQKLFLGKRKNGVVLPIVNSSIIPPASRHQTFLTLCPAQKLQKDLFFPFVTIVCLLKSVLPTLLDG